MGGLPWGIILLLPASTLLFRNKGRRLAKELDASRRGLLWYIFFLLLGAFITVSATTFYINMSGMVALVFAMRLTLRLAKRERLRLLLAAVASGLFCYAYQTGLFWWLVRLPFATDWLLPLTVGALAALLGLSAAPAAAGLIFGMLFGYVAALVYISDGLIAVEFGSLACVNTLLLALFICLLCLRLLNYREWSAVSSG